ncbi:CaiB/BaiF CoA transferase family protein [Gelidibacter sp. F63206]|uniref:CaiB/BaiF CoA transferase family protein n=1 Tax=Gelidibacter sp. F63206 TaxID=2926425 RepID=UPI001FF45A01|nr:CaiB/BaiF CoA-transferase family protein [Gelidibacter sp. F63206]MCK0114748.1 CoA transferase [Gelidibacter sp. F63206]
MQESKPLQGVTVIDFTRLLPGPLGTHLLSQLGAKVMKIESPKRLDYTRFYEPKLDDSSFMFHTMNHSKEILNIDYETEEGYKNVCGLIATADVLIEQFRPGAMASFNLDFDTVKKINPNIVYVSVTGYGQSGELQTKAGHDINYLATAGLLDLNRDEKGKPVIPGFQIADIAGGSYMLLSACTSGLLAQKLQNKPQYIDLSLLDATMPLNAIAHSMAEGGASYKQTPILSGMLVNYNVYECSDGKWMALGALEMKFWNVFCDMVEKPEWKRTSELELINGVFPKKELDVLFKTKTRDEWARLSATHDICLSPILQIEEVTMNTHLMERHVFNDSTIKNRTLKTYAAPFKTYS